ncbi:MAG: SemiSWEET family transporter [Tenuifilum sp.]|uniref:SemiSWEET family sugar transporter n=1 Tax=Tenuifilum sp. TaxID=2760880 RepID=UPI0030A40873
MIDVAQVFGLLGSITAASLFFPQVYTSWKTKKTHDLAWSGIAIGLLNGVFWIVYGLIRLDPFIYLTNTILLIGAFLLLILKKRYG